jgi:hypothetical protein
MKKAEYSRLSRGGPGGVPGSSTALLTGRGSASARSAGFHPSSGRGSGIAMLLEYRGTREGHTDLESGATLVSVCLLVPLPVGSTRKKEVTSRIGCALVGG